MLFAPGFNTNLVASKGGSENVGRASFEKPYFSAGRPSQFTIESSLSARDPARKTAMEELLKVNDKLMASFESINFNRKTINRIVIKFKNLVGRMSILRRRIKDGTERTFSKDVNAIVERLKLIDGNEKELTKMTRETGLNYNKFRSYAIQAQEVVQSYAEELAPGACPYADPYYWAGFQITGW